MLAVWAVKLISNFKIKNMIDFKKFMPSAFDEPFLAKTKYGIRVIEKNSQFMNWRYTDCTHHMMNCACNPYDIEEWEYIDKSKMSDLLFEESWIGKKIIEEQGNVILSNLSFLKPKKFFSIKDFWAKIIKI